MVGAGLALPNESAASGIIAFTRNAARELLPLNIQVHAVLPVARSGNYGELDPFLESGAFAGAVRGCWRTEQATDS